MLRVSIDAKARVWVGPFSRRGRSRVSVQACDHDFTPKQQISPVGILLPHNGEVAFYGIHSKVTSDCLVDCLSDWWRRVRGAFGHITTLLLNLDNGPENHSHRTQFVLRILEFVREFKLSVHLAYYPPYHSKFNPIEHCWGVLERHWNGALLETVEAVEGWMASMTWRGQHPHVTMVQTDYPTGIKLRPAEMAKVEAQIVRHETLPRFFVSFSPELLRDD